MQIHPALVQVLIAERERELQRSARLAGAARRPRPARHRRRAADLLPALRRAGRAATDRRARAYGR